MEWSKTSISKAELEKKQHEFIEQAMKMAKKASHSEKTEEKLTVVTEVKEAEQPTAETEETVAVPEESIEDVFEEAVMESIPEDQEEIMMCEDDTPCEEEPLHETKDYDEEPTFGVFDAEELTKAIESGEITGDGLKQATEILAEMTAKTEAMRKLLAEQEEENYKNASNGADIGLNNYIDRHNNSCRGCTDGKADTP